eukprot:TRINITY_DN1065_c0_g2_i3.p1 TRINITY_DN1065_c0_g2~~TRINITY_DN1065_c0_g2_i3.p1  ORF type:complete len:611 (-),score=119.30 TRINITY_DN1065_c0_g2_i3:115-1767(-)
MDCYLSLSIASSLLSHFGISRCISLSCTAFQYSSSADNNMELYQTLLNSGYKILHFLPGQKHEIEKVMSTDIALWAMDNPYSCIILISGSSDLSYVASKLKQRGYRICLVGVPSPAMLEACDSYISWTDFLCAFNLSMAPEKLLPESPNPSFISSHPPHPSTIDAQLPSKTIAKEARKSQAKYPPKLEDAALREFKIWLKLTVRNSKGGYNISAIPRDYQRAVGKMLDPRCFGCSNVKELVVNCRDEIFLKESKPNCYIAFPLRKNKNLRSKPPTSHTPNAQVPSNPHPNSQQRIKPNPKSSTLNPQKDNSNHNAGSQYHANPNSEVPTEEENPEKASVLDFRLCMNSMLQIGYFSQGMLLSELPQRFKERAGLSLDVKHLGYPNLGDLVESADGLCLRKDGKGPVWIFPEEEEEEKEVLFDNGTESSSVSEINDFCVKQKNGEEMGNVLCKEENETKKTEKGKSEEVCLQQLHAGSLSSLNSVSLKKEKVEEEKMQFGIGLKISDGQATLSEMQQPPASASQNLTKEGPVEEKKTGWVRNLFQSLAKAV